LALNVGQVENKLWPGNENRLGVSMGIVKRRCEFAFYTCMLLPRAHQKGSFERSISAWQRRRRQ